MENEILRIADTMRWRSGTDLPCLSNELILTCGLDAQSQNDIRGGQNLELGNRMEMRYKT